MSDGGRQRFAAGIGVLFVVVGLALAVGVPYSEYQDQQVGAGLETTTGTVLSTDVESHTVTEDGERETEYYPRVTYEYTVDGQRYEGDRIYAATEVDTEDDELRGREFDSRNAASAVTDRFEVGNATTVHYAPDDPARAYLLQPGFDAKTAVIGFLAGALFATIGYLVASKGLRGELDY